MQARSYIPVAEQHGRRVMAIEQTGSTPTNAREWVQILAQYRDPNPLRSGFELAISLIPFIALWILACWVAHYSYLGAFLISGRKRGRDLMRAFGLVWVFHSPIASSSSWF